MKIELSKNLVEFTPEGDNEKTMLEALWRMLVDCMRFNQKLVPVGEYIPGKSDTATFAVEGEGDDVGEAVLKGVVLGEAERLGVGVCEAHARALGGGAEAGGAEAAAHLEGVDRAHPDAVPEVRRHGARARPHLGPLRGLVRLGLGGGRQAVAAVEKLEAALGGVLRARRRLAEL